MSFFPVQSHSIGFIKMKNNWDVSTHSNYQLQPYKQKESFSQLRAIVFLTVRPPEELVRCVEKLCVANYHVFICMDDNQAPIPSHDTSKITFIRYNQGIAEKVGYLGSVAWVPDRASSRCKALYHFAHLPHSYEYVWMIEEDVFIPSKHTIKYLDEMYPSGDLLCTGNDINTTGELTSWPWWEKIKDKISLPWSKSMICAIRVSPKLLKKIDEFTTKIKSLLFDETLFTTIALHHFLKVINPPELSDIVYWNKTWDVKEFKENHLYHPLKNWKDHIEYKEQMGMEYYHELPTL
jgi:hypothetical protein